jgi:phage pi2 protein 07
MALRQDFSGIGVSLVVLEWTADEKPSQLVVPFFPEDEDAVAIMVSDHQKFTAGDGRTYHCKEVASLCTVYRNEKGELSVCEAGIGAVLGTWRMVDKGLFAEVQCVSFVQSGAEVETQFKLQVILYLAHLKDSICVLQDPHFRKRLERKEGGVIHYVTRNFSQIPFVTV